MSAAISATITKPDAAAADGPAVAGAPAAGVAGAGVAGAARAGEPGKGGPGSGGPGSGGAGPGGPGNGGPGSGDGEGNGRAVQPTVWQLAWPSMLSNLLFSLGGIVAMKVVGELGASAVAAVTSGNQIFYALQAVMMAISAGTTALVARAWGSEDYDEAIAITKVSLLVSCVAAVVMTVPGVLFPVQIAMVFGLDAATTELAGDYILWMSVFSVVFAVNMILGSALRAAGDARTPLWLGIATNVIYLGLVFAFVYGWGVIPAMGVAGAAIANGVAFAVAGLALLVAWWRGWLMLGYDRKPYWHKRRVRELLDIGYPAGIEQIVFRVGFFLFLGIIGTYYGTAAFAAYGIGVNVLSVCFVVGFGFSIASSTLVGQNLGAGDPAAATRAAWRSLRMSFVAMAVVGAVIIAFARPLAEFMTHDPEVIDHTIVFVWILGAMMPLMAIDFSIGGALRGAGDTRYPLRATLVGLLGMRCGLAVLFAWMGLGVEWIYAALIGDYLAKGLILLYRFRSGRWRRVFERMRRERARADAQEAAEAEEAKEAAEAAEAKALTEAGQQPDGPTPPR